jgi:alpha-ketoglutarate-dependent taurine dioxygenase
MEPTTTLHEVAVHPAGRAELPSPPGLTTGLYADATLPLIIRPQTDGIALSDWCRDSRPWMGAALDRHGALLFLGFGLRGLDDLEQFVAANGIDPMQYVEGATPRTKLQGHVYTSTEFPSQHAIAMHNELSYVLTWPMRLACLCVLAPGDRGATPLADVRRVWHRLAPDITEPFVAKGWMLVRNFGDGLGPTWQKAYLVDDRSALTDYAQRARITLEWKDGDRLRTRQVRPAVARHPRTGERVWFNHVAFWHVSGLESELREVLLDEHAESDLPYNTYYGDGTAIDEQVVAEIRRAYDAETVVCPWQNGDLLLVDNMLGAYGREPFSGPRRIVVSRGDPYTRTDFQA